MENSSSSLACSVLYDKLDNPENMDIDQNEENEGERDTSTADDLEIPNPLEMLDIVGLFLKKLDGKSLKSSLMVSKLWNEEGMKLFIKNHCIRIPPKLNFKTKHGKKETIKQLKKLSSKFTLIPDVAINKSRDLQILKDSKILEQVKYVKINKETEDYGATIEKVIEECPNLSFLQVEDDHSLWPSLMQKIVEAGKDGSFTISNVYTILTNPGVMEQFANSGVRVVHLQLGILTTNPIQLVRISSILEKILHSSKDCLETLKLSMERSSLSSIKNIPLLLELKKLYIQIWPQYPISALELATIFPLGFKFSENCPNLKTCSFTFLVGGVTGSSVDLENILNMTFATTGPASSVKSLIFSSAWIPVKLDKLFQTFDGIESLTMGFYVPGTDLSPVWKFCRNLKSFKMGLRPDDDDSCQLLARLTGYSLDFIIGLWNSSADLKKLDLPPRAGSSILNLQDLESLTMNYSKKAWVSKFDELIYELALRYMPKMKKRQETA